MSGPEQVDHLSVELRKARMLAAAEEFYIDRRLVANILVSYFHGHPSPPTWILSIVTK